MIKRRKSYTDFSNDLGKREEADSMSRKFYCIVSDRSLFRLIPGKGEEFRLMHLDIDPFQF